MVCGDSGNDVELFAVPGVRGCMVVNAHQELKQWCDAHASPELFQASSVALRCLSCRYIQPRAHAGAAMLYFGDFRASLG